MSFSESFLPLLPVAAFAFPALIIKTFGSEIFLFIFSKHISTGADLNLFEVNKPDQIAFFSSFTIAVSNLVPYFVAEDAQPIFIFFNIIFFSSFYWLLLAVFASVYFPLQLDRYWVLVG